MHLVNVRVQQVQYTFTVSATTVAGSVEYSIGAGFQSNGTFTVDAPGVYPVTIRDKNGCSNLLPFNVTILDPILPSATVKLPKCNDADGEITVTATGGNGPANFEYSIDGTNYGPSNVFSLLAPNTYRLYVRDMLSGCVKFIDEKIDPAAIITDFELNQTPVTCFGFTDGTITATMKTPSLGINDNPKYMYSLDGGIPQESNVFSNLATGHYKVVVTSARGCEAEAEIDVESPLVITVPAPAVTQFSCVGGTNAGDFAIITVSGVTGGSNSFANYEFIKVGTPPTLVYFGSEPTYTVYDKTGGFYIVNVYDSNGCLGTAPAQIEIKPFIELDKITVNVDNAITCGNLEDITVSVSTIGGAATNLQYTVVDVDATTGVQGTLYPMQTQLNNGVFTGLPVANYLITVTNLDSNCSIEYIHYVNSPKTFDLTLDNVKDVSCFGGTNGSVDVTFVDLLISTNPFNADQAGPFKYDVTDSLGNIVASVLNTGSAGPITIPNLAAGVYTIKATLVNTPFCDVTENFTIAQPSAALDITEQHEEITCVTGDGKIEVTATGGWPGVYQYELRTGATIIKPYNDSPVFDNLVAGNYTVYVTDGKCEDFVNVPLTNPIPISAIIIADKTAVLCYDDATATITVNTISGGSGNYAYTLHGTLVDNTTVTIGTQPENIFTNLAAGSYYVTVSDDWTCSAPTNTVIIGEPDKMEVSLEHGIEETCDITPTVILRATGGTGPYFYSVDGTNYNPASFASFVEIPLPATTADVEYEYYVKDSNNCTSVLSNKVPYLPVPVLKFETLNAYDIKCTGSANGAITAVAIGGLGNYIYVLADATGIDITPAPTQLSPGEFTGLPAGKYTVKVNSVDCDTSGIIEILEPGTAVNAVATPTNIKCAGSDNGTITIVASGGVPGYTYAITPELEQFFDVPVFENLKPGPYTVRIQDANGCYIDKPVIITEPDPLFAKDLPNLNVPQYCSDVQDGIIYVEVTLNSGTAPYKASIDNGPLVDPDPTDIEGNNFIFTGLTGGEHSIDIFDANGCRYPLTSTLPDAITLNPSAKVEYTCELDIPVNAIVVSVDPSITEAQKATIIYTVVETGVSQVGNPVFPNLAPGDYTVKVELDGCSRTTTPAVTVNFVDDLKLAFSDTEMNVINASATGGVGNYQYNFNDEGYTSSNRYKIYKTGEYLVKVMDENGCTDERRQVFTYIDVCIPNYFTPNGDGLYDDWGPGCTNIYNNLDFSIFDRYGRVIAKYHYGQKWDGRYNGEELPTGDYWYVLKLNDEKDAREFVGHFTLYR